MAISDYLSLTSPSVIGGIEIQATLEENYSDTLQITEQPVEQGASITDHAYKRPSEVVIRCGWSNSSIDALAGTFSAFFDGGSASGSSYIDGVYSQLLALQQGRQPFTITTARRQYSNMLIVALQVTRDNRTNDLLMVSATCREIIIVSTQATTLPPSANQANPASTAETVDAGVKQPQTGATPSPGGALSPSEWTG